MDSGSRMQVQRGFKPKIMKILQAVFRVREKFLLPGVASPTDPLAKLVLRCLVPPKRPGLVPIHIQNHHIDRDVQRADLLSKPHELEVRILPETAPPVAKGIFRRHRDASSDLGEVGDGSLVVVTVGEQVKVLTISRVTFGNPIFPIGIDRHKDLSVRLIHDGPAVPRDDSLVVRFLGLGTVATVQRPRRSEQIAAVIHPRMPSHRPDTFL